jgi:acyl-CoA thioesterase-1
MRILVSLAWAAAACAQTECSWDKLAQPLGLASDERYLYLQPAPGTALKLSGCTLAGIRLGITVEKGWTLKRVNGIDVKGPVRLDRRVNDGVVHFLASPPARGAAPPDPSTVPVQDAPGLPRVLLIGDSVSMGYTLPVRERLDGRANVHRPPENGGNSSLGLRKLDGWLGDGRWDAIHFNFGLHDLVYVFDSGANLDADGNYAIPANGHQRTPLALYESNLRQIVARLRKTGARLVWASTTPVPADLHSYVKAAELPYNEVATRVMREEGVEIDDLWGFATPMLDKIQIPGNVHFTPEGSRILAIQIAQSIDRALKGYRLLFEDLFGGSAVNERNWKFREGRRTGTGIDGMNLRENVTVSGGGLHIAARQETIAGRVENTGGGLISRRQFGYGYYETLSRPFMDGRGVHSSFWQAGGAKPNNDIFEIDSYEIDSRTPMGCNNLYLHISPKNNPVPWPSRANVPIQLLPGGWFLDAYEYTPDGVIFYDNGTVVNKAEWKDLTAQQAVWLTALNGAGKVEADKLPGETIFRYFRYYAKDHPGVNLLPNGGFEYNQDRIDPATPVAWQQEGTPGAGRVVEGNAARDRYKLRHGLGSGPWQAATRQTLEHLPNGAYELVANVRASAGLTQATIRAGGASVAIPAAGAWTTVAIPRIAVENHEVTIEIASAGGAGEWVEFDDIVFRRPGPVREPEPFTLVRDPAWRQGIAEPIRFTGDDKFYFFDRSVGLGDAITVAFTMIPDAMATTSPIARIPKTGRSGWAVQLTEKGGLIFRIGGGSDHRDVLAPNAYAAGRAARVVCVFDRGTARIHVDGRVLKSETGIVQDTRDTSAPGRLGATGETYLAVGDVIAANPQPHPRTRNYSGLLQDVRVYNRALSQEEAAQLK